MPTRPVLVVSGVAAFAGVTIALAAPASAAPSPSATSAPAAPSSSALVPPRPVAPTPAVTRAPGGIAVSAGNARVPDETSGASSAEIVSLVAAGIALAGGGLVLARRRA